MSTKCKSCGSCGMPLEKREDHALGDPTQPYCHYCTDPRGKLLPWETVLAANAKFYQESQGITAEAATSMAHAMLTAQPAWKAVRG